MLTAITLFALSTTAHAVEPATATQVEATERAPIKTSVTVSGRYNSAAPAYRQGLAHAGSITFGSENRRGHVFAIRVTGLPNPPNVLGIDTPRFAMGPSFVWEKHIPIATGVDLYPAGSAGLLYGVSPDGTNVFLPTIQAGGGARATFKAGARTRGFVSADFGLSVTSAAPYAAINIGMLLDPK